MWRVLQAGLSRDTLKVHLGLAVRGYPQHCTGADN